MAAMTSEQYAIIVAHALRLMGEMPDRELAKIEPWLTRRHIRHARKFEDPSRKVRREILATLRKSVAHLKAKYPS